MPTPKRKTSKSRRDMRSACKFLRPQAVTTCSQCAIPVLPHVVCSTCGYYKGKKILVTKLDRALKRGEKRKHTAAQQQPMSSATTIEAETASSQE